MAIGELWLLVSCVVSLQNSAGLDRAAGWILPHTIPPPLHMPSTCLPPSLLLNSCISLLTILSSPLPPHYSHPSHYPSPTSCPQRTLTLCLQTSCVHHRDLAKTEAVASPLLAPRCRLHSPHLSASQAVASAELGCSMCRHSGDGGTADMRMS